MGTWARGRVGAVTRWLCSMILLCCMACGNNGSEEDPVVETSNPYIEIKVYTPERQVVTRADLTEPLTAAAEAEQKIHNLKIWVFTHDNGELVGYYQPSSDNLPDKNSPSKTYKITVTEAFALNPPHVDVYVLANDSYSSSSPFSRASTQSQLKAATISRDEFGVTSPVTAVPEDKGLPMSGVLLDTPVQGLAPVLRVDNNVKVVRAVSKVRFVFSSMKVTGQTLKITGVELYKSMIPHDEYLFLNGEYTGREYYFNDESGYDPGTASLINNQLEVRQIDNPADYAYVSQTGQAYEDLINKGVNEEDVNKKLTDGGQFYLRESDKQIQGKIKYTITNASGTKESSADFATNAEGDFSRNHLWIVYAYFAGNDNLKVYSVSYRPWVPEQTEHSIYNW